MGSLTLTQRIVYPERDGKPMAETDVHVTEIADMLHMLRARYRNELRVYVGANMLCYYEEGVPSSSFSPDVFVVFGVPKKRRRTYKLWEEKKPPTVIFEVSSRESRLEDLGNKKFLYASLGVSEYFVYDPLREYLRPPLQGFRLHSSDYEPLAPDAAGTLSSERLNLRMNLESEGLALWDAATGERLLRPAELEAEVERLRKELGRRKDKR